MSTRRTALRAHTADVHERLHHQAPFAQIARGAFGSAEVCEMVRLHDRCWRAYAHPANDVMCQTLFGCDAAALFDLTETPRTAAGTTRTVGPGAACGAAYVYLGSKFGGAILARQLAAAGHAEIAARIRMSDQNKAAWRRLLDALEDLDAGEFQACLTEADRAFAAFETPDLTPA